MIIYKTVDVITKKPIQHISKPINSSVFDIRLTLDDILVCILEKATVLEVLPDGRKIKLTLSNYKRDNIIGDDDTDPSYNNGKTSSFPFISTVLYDDKDCPYLVTGDAIKAYIVQHGGSGSGEGITLIDGKNFTENGTTIRIKRGSKDNIPLLKTGELGIAVDEERLYIGGVQNNIPLPSTKDLTSITQTINNIPNADELTKAIASIENKVEKVEGFGLSSNDYTTSEKQAVATIGDKANAIETANQIQEIKNQINTILGMLGVSDFTITLNSDTTTAEMGSTINSINFTWSFNKLPKSQIFDGQSLETSLRAFNYTTPLTTDKTFTLSAVSTDGISKTATSSIKFLNGIYYGVSSSTTYDSALISSLTKVLSDTKARSITENAATPSDYIYYCLPTRLGIPAFKVGGFEGGFAKMATVAFKNASGYTEDYDIYRSDNGGLGTTNIDIL